MSKFDRIHQVRREFARQLLRSRLNNLDFSIISDDCHGGLIYKELGFPYSSPFVGLFILAPCYLKLLSNLDYYLRAKLAFQDYSKYPEVELKRLKGAYPIGLLGGDIEIHFLHYKNEQEAQEKWFRRMRRVNFDNLFIKFSGHVNYFREYCQDEQIKQFSNLEYQNKICFVLDLKWKDFESKGIFYLKDRPIHYYSFHFYFDISKWLNGGSGRISPQLSFLNRILYYRYQSY